MVLKVCFSIGKEYGELVALALALCLHPLFLKVPILLLDVL